MKPSRIKLIFYSPTGTSEKTVKSIQKGIESDYDVIDLTPPDSEMKKHNLTSNDLAIIGVPVYCNRVPPTAAKRLKNISGNNTPAVNVVVYGNRAYGDALLELKNVTEGQGFKTIAGAAFIGQHSLNSETSPIATGRPDEQDLQNAEDFGVKILEKMESLDEIPELEVHGNYPYDEEHRARVASLLEDNHPVTDAETCILCGTCATVCPIGCVEVSDKVETEKGKCTACSACVQNCPTGARRWEHEGALQTAKRLSTEHGARKEPEIFI